MRIYFTAKARNDGGSMGFIIAKRFLLLLFFHFLLGFSLVTQAAVYTCTNEKGKKVFSDKPCGDTVEEVTLKETNVAGAGGSKANAKTPIIGTWETRYMTYYIRPGGSLRTEERHDGKLFIWRTGRWTMKGETLSLHYTKAGGPAFKTRAAGLLGPAGKMDYKESGTVEWSDEERDSFSITLDRRDRYFVRK